MRMEYKKIEEKEAIEHEIILLKKQKDLIERFIEEDEKKLKTLRKEK